MATINPPTAAQANAALLDSFRIFQEIRRRNRAAKTESPAAATKPYVPDNTLGDGDQQPNGRNTFGLPETTSD